VSKAASEHLVHKGKKGGGLHRQNEKKTWKRKLVNRRGKGENLGRKMRMRRLTKRLGILQRKTNGTKSQKAGTVTTLEEEA